MTAILYGTFGLNGHRNNIVEQEYFWTQIQFNHDH